MIRNYLISAWRNLARHRMYGLINIAGLAIGMTSGFLLLLFVYHEMSFDGHNLNSGRLYQVFKNQKVNAEIRTRPLTPEPLAYTLRENFPEIEKVARTNFPEDVLASFKDRHVKLSTIATDTSLLEMFTFDFLYGNKESAFVAPSSVILTQSAASAVFGNENAIGQVVRLGDSSLLTVSAVIKDHPKNSSWSFAAMISWETLSAQQPWIKDAGWGNYNFATYALLKPGAALSQVNSKIIHTLAKYNPDDKDINLFLYPATRLHLYGDFENGVNTGGRIAYVKLFLLLAIGIMVIACINFMNLSTAQSERRAREVGVRKAIGARRSSLIAQFIGESFVTALLAFVLSLVMVGLLLPFFNQVVHMQLELPYANSATWVVAVGIMVVIGVAAGGYPAFFLSALNPVRVLKGQIISAQKSVGPRQMLVIIQFTFATGLILSSIFIYRQINYVKLRPVGYDREGLIEMPVEGSMVKNFETFRRNAIQSGAITDAALTSGAITVNRTGTWGNVWPGQLPGEDKISIDCIAVTYHFSNTYGLTIVQGRDFSPDVASDSTGVILNKSAVNLMRMKDPVGQEITWLGSKRTIVGVVDDFVWGSPYEPVKPAIIAYQKDWTGNIALRLDAHKPIAESLRALESVYKTYNPDYPFSFKFTAEDFNKKFESENLLGTLSLSFTVLAIFISCLGLFGLASFAVAQRKKEIGIRKILGASNQSLWFRLSGEFLKIVIVSFFIGSLVTWYNIDQWLARYTFRTAFNIWIFVFTLVITMIVCLAAVSAQTLMAVRANPVDSLRTD